MNALQRFATTAAAIAASASWATTDIATTLTTSYAKVAESAGPITGLSLSGITAFDGTGQVEFACVSNRPYAAETADSAIGELPAGPYVHQLSVFNYWDGTRTRSYRVQIAQPVGSTDIYAYCPCFTVSQPGVNLVDYPDIRDLRADTSKIEASYTTSSGLGGQLAANPVTALKLTAVPYVESDGTSGIDTGYRMKPNSRLEVDFAALDGIAASTRIFGADYRNTDLKTACNLYVSANRNYFVYGVGNADTWKEVWIKDAGSNTYNSIMRDTNRHVAVIDLNGGALRHETPGGISVSADDPLAGTYTDESTQTLSLFARRSEADLYQLPAKARIYGVRIYESNVLVHDFIPCTHDGIASFRDAVTGDFIYGEQAPLAFTVGGDFETYESPYVATPAANSAYYIDTGYQATSNTCVELDCALLNAVDGDAYGALFCGAGSCFFMGFINPSSGFGAQTDTAKPGILGLAEANRTGVRRTFALDAFNRKAYVTTAGVTNGVDDVPASTEHSSSPVTIKIASRFNGTANYTSLKVYGCKIYEEGVLVRDFVPYVVSPTDGHISVGLRDTKTGAFATYPDATASSRLTCGGEGMQYDAPPYVETLRSARRYVDTGYSVTANTKVALDYAPVEARTSGDTWYLFAAKGTHNFAAYINNRGFGFINSSSWKMDVGASVGASAVDVRRTVILDNPANLGAIVTEGVTNATCATTTGGPFAGSTLKIAAPQNADTHLASIRIYGCKIWEKENGEYALKRDYVPAVENNVAGLRDATGSDTTFRVCASTAASPLTYGGVFTPAVTPAAATVSHGYPTTLTASAPGTASYRWLKNGEPIDGATGATLAAAYGGVGVIDSYQAIAVYTIDDATMERGPSAPVSVEGIASATVIVIK